MRVTTAFGYVCVEDDDENLITSHHDRLMVVAKARELSLVEIFVDRYAAIRQDRPGFDEVLGSMSKYPSSVLLVPSIRHLSPDPSVRNVMRQTMRELGGSLLSLETTPLPFHGVDRSRHPLGQLRLQHGWSFQAVARMIARKGREQGINMAAERQKIWRWENRGVVPDRFAQGCLAEVLGIDPTFIDSHPWPTWLPTAEDPECVKEIARLRDELAEVKDALAVAEADLQTRSKTHADKAMGLISTRSSCVAKRRVI